MGTAKNKPLRRARRRVNQGEKTYIIQKRTKRKIGYTQAMKRLKGHILWLWLWQTGYEKVPAAERRWWENNFEQYEAARELLPEQWLEAVEWLEARVDMPAAAKASGVSKNSLYHCLKMGIRFIVEIMEEANE